MSFSKSKVKAIIIAFTFLILGCENKQLVFRYSMVEYPILSVKSGLFEKTSLFFNCITSAKSELLRV
jgi:hypothetical protein